MSSILGQVLGSVFANAGLRGARAPSGEGGLGGLGGLGGSGGLGGLGGALGGALGGGGLGGGLGGAALGGVLGSVLGGGRGGRGGMGGRGALLALLLPVALQWVQRNGGLGAVLGRFGERGYGRQSQSWMSPGANEAIDPQAVDDVVGSDEIAAIARQLGVERSEVSHGFAELLPEVADQLTPEGQLPENENALMDHALQQLSALTRAEPDAA